MACRLYVGYMARQGLRGDRGVSWDNPPGSRQAPAPTCPTEKRATANTDQWGRRGEEGLTRTTRSRTRGGDLLEKARAPMATRNPKEKEQQEVKERQARGCEPEAEKREDKKLQPEKKEETTISWI